MMYCPMCLGELDKTGSCWIRCEYAYDITPPLTRVSMLQRRLVDLERREIDLHERLSYTIEQQDKIRDELNE